MDDNTEQPMHLNIPLGNKRLPLAYHAHVTSEGLDYYGFMGAVEKCLVEAALLASDNSRSGAAALLKMNRTTLVEKLRKFGHIVPKVKKK